MIPFIVSIVTRERVINPRVTNHSTAVIDRASTTTHHSQALEFCSILTFILSVLCDRKVIKCIYF